MDYLINITTEKEVKVEIGANFYISVTPDIYKELMAYVEHYDTEVSGCGMVNVIKHEDSTEYAITEVFLPSKQKNNKAYTEVDDSTMHAMLYSMLKNGIDTSKIRMHWHSHNDMRVFHSGTDTDNYATLHKQDFFISLVLNHDRDIYGRVDLAIPFKVSISGVRVCIKVPLDTKEEVQNRIDSNIKALDDSIAKEASTVIHGFGGSYLPYDYMEDTPKKKKKKKKKKKGVYGSIELDDDDEYETMIDGLDMYTPYEQTMYENCDGHVTGRHVCNNPLECSAYHTMLDKIEEYECGVAYGK